DAGFLALRHVVADAVVTAKHERCDEAEHLLRLHVERAALIRLRVECEEAAHDLVVVAEDALVHALSELREIVDAAHAPPSPSFDAHSSLNRPLPSPTPKSS